MIYNGLRWLDTSEVLRRLMTADIGTRIRDLRRAQGLSQEEVAGRTNIGLKTYSRLEQGRTKDPHYSTLLGIALALGVPVEDLVREPSLTGKAEAPPAGPQGRLERELERFVDNARLELRRAKLEEVKSCTQYAIDRAQYYKEELERGRTEEYATYKSAYNLAVLAVDEFSSFNRWLFNKGPARPLLVAMEQGVGLEIEEEYDALIDALIDHISLTQLTLFENAAGLAETKPQKERIAAKRGEMAASAQFARRSA
jgi:transcriptional regulator with XRE-family HTH domain